MIQLYNSQQAIGHFGSGNVYSPPNPVWYFDTNFVATPSPACSPPLTTGAPAGTCSSRESSGAR